MVLMQVDNVLTSAHYGKHTRAGFREFVQSDPEIKTVKLSFSYTFDQIKHVSS